VGLLAEVPLAVVEAKIALGQPELLEPLRHASPVLLLERGAARVFAELPEQGDEFFGARLLKTGPVVGHILCCHKDRLLSFSLVSWRIVLIVKLEQIFGQTISDDVDLKET